MKKINILTKLKKELKEPHIFLALATGASIIIMAYFSKKILSKPIDYLLLSIPPFFMVIYEVVYKKYKDHWISKPLIWVVVIFVSTAIIVLAYMYL